MNKIYKLLFGSTLSILALTLSSCQLSAHCYKVGYSQQINATTFDSKNSKGYFVYSYFTKKNQRDYFLYKIDLNGKYDLISKIDSRMYQTKNSKDGNQQYSFDFIGEDKLFIRENFYKYGTRNDDYTNYYLVDLNKKELVYKKEGLFYSPLVFSPNKKEFIRFCKESCNNKLYVFNIESGLQYDLDLNSDLPQKKDYQSITEKWIDSENVLIYVKENDILKKSIIYSVKDNKITKANEYVFKSDEPSKFENKDFTFYYNLYPISYSNNKFNYYTERSKNDSKYKYTYSIDFLKNELTLLEESQVNNEEVNSTYDDNNKEQIYLTGNSLYYKKDNKNNFLIDYKEKLPKEFFDDSVSCGDFSFEHINTYL